MLGGHAVSALLFVLARLEVVTLHFTIMAGLLALVSAAIFALVSLAGAPPTEQQIAQYTFRRATTARQPELGWWQDYRLYSLVLVTLAILLVIAHW